MHCLDSQTVSEYISTIVPDDNEKRSINEKLDILLVLPVKVVSIHKASNFFTMNELKKSVQGGLQLHTESAFCWNSKLLHTTRCLWKIGQMYLYVVE